MPRPEAVGDLKIEVGDSITAIQYLVETHKLREVEVSGGLLLLDAVSAWVRSILSRRLDKLIGDARTL